MNAGALLLEAFKHHQENKLDAAASGYARVLAIDPLHPDALNLLGVLYSKEKDYPLAIAHLSAAIAAKVGFVDAWLNLAKTFSSAGERPRRDMPVSTWRIAGSLRPSDRARPLQAST